MIHQLSLSLIDPWQVRTISFAPAINGSDRAQWEQQNNYNITTLLPDNQFSIARKH